MSWTNDTEPSGLTWRESPEGGEGFVLKEDGGYLLLETGDNIIIDGQTTSYTNGTEGADPTWTNQSEA